MLQMNFSTKVTVLKHKNPIDYNAKIFSIGSCFAENIGKKFTYFKFENIVNPFGIIFNPVAIENLIFRIVNKIKFTDDDVFYHNDLWHCYEVHSELSNENKEDLLDNLNFILAQSDHFLIEASHIIITYGTSWVYKHKAFSKIVANCHKVPQNEFDKEILSIQEIENTIQNSVNLIQKINTNCQFIFTVSPVRHIKDGFVENNVSKAHLIAAIYKITNLRLPSINYFPSFEIMMDELRDYRFYAEDMLHPSQVAIDYIWEKFADNYISPQEFAAMKTIDEIQKALAHRSFNPHSINHQKFLSATNQKIKNLQEKLPFIRF